MSSKDFVFEKDQKIDRPLSCFKTIGIFLKHKMPDVENVLKSLIKLEDDDTKFIISNDAKGILKDDNLKFGDISKTDLIITLGGDGTLINAAKRFSPHNIPIMGINLGHLGFLTEARKHEVNEVLYKLKNNLFQIEERTMIQAQLIKEGSISKSFYALNEVVLGRKTTARIVKVAVKINGELLGNYSGDGVIVSTPTGSTGYSLSAGGPIIEPLIPVMEIAPICPHSFYGRPALVSNERIITLEPDTSYGSEILLTVDGQESVDIESGMTVEVKKADITTKLVKLSDVNFYELVREKLTSK